MSRRRGRNDILPRLPIAPHPQLTTDKSAFSPLDKIARQSTPGWRAVWMECCVHDLPPTPATVRNLVSHAGMSVTRGTKSQSSAAARANTSAPRHPGMALPGSRCLFNGRTRRQGRISQGATAPAAWRCWRRWRRASSRVSNWQRRSSPAFILEIDALGDGWKRREGIPAVGGPPCLIALGINPSVHNKSKSTEPWPIFALHQSHREGRC